MTHLIAIACAAVLVCSVIAKLTSADAVERRRLNRLSRDAWRQVEAATAEDVRDALAKFTFIIAVAVGVVAVAAVALI